METASTLRHLTAASSRAAPAPPARAPLAALLFGLRGRERSRHCPGRRESKSGVVKKSWWRGYGENYAGWWKTPKYKCRLRKGTYRIVVTGKDLAGNSASVIGRAKLKVK